MTGPAGNAREGEEREEATPYTLHPRPSVADRPLLARVDVLLTAGLEEERLHVLRQELARLRVHDVEPVVVDQHRLLLQPVAPALLTDLGDDLRADGAREWR